MAKKKPVESITCPKKLIVVTWVDSYFDDDTHTQEELQTEDKTCIIHSTGFLADDTNKSVITIGMDWCPSGSHFRHVCRIRRENIQSIHKITGDPV